MQHFLIDNPLTEKELAIRDKVLLHQMIKVLRFKAGDECVLMNGHGAKAKGKIEELHKKAATIVVSELEQMEAPQKTVRLFCALSKKPSTFELIIQKATELGVSEIVPLVTERCQIKELRKPERLEMIIKEACEQCERFFLPELKAVLSLDMLLSEYEEKKLGPLLAGDPWNYDVRLSDYLQGYGSNEERAINLIIGPEGGLTEAELHAIQKAGGTLFVLSESVLRMETAAIAALSLVTCR